MNTRGNSGGPVSDAVACASPSLSKSLDRSPREQPAARDSTRAIAVRTSASTLGDRREAGIRDRAMRRAARQLAASESREPHVEGKQPPEEMAVITPRALVLGRNAFHR